MAQRFDAMLDRVQASQACSAAWWPTPRTSCARRWPRGGPTWRSCWPAPSSGRRATRPPARHGGPVEAEPAGGRSVPRAGLRPRTPIRSVEGRPAARAGRARRGVAPAAVPLAGGPPPCRPRRRASSLARRTWFLGARIHMFSSTTPCAVVVQPAPRLRVEVSGAHRAPEVSDLMPGGTEGVQACRGEPSMTSSAAAQQPRPPSTGSGLGPGDPAADVLLDAHGATVHSCSTPRRGAGLTVAPPRVRVGLGLLFAASWMLRVALCSLPAQLSARVWDKTEVRTGRPLPARLGELYGSHGQLLR